MLWGQRLETWKQRADKLKEIKLSVDKKVVILDQRTLLCIGRRSMSQPSTGLGCHWFCQGDIERVTTYACQLLTAEGTVFFMTCRVFAVKALFRKYLKICFQPALQIHTNTYVQKQWMLLLCLHFFSTVLYHLLVLCSWITSIEKLSQWWTLIEFLHYSDEVHLPSGWRLSGSNAASWADSQDFYLFVSGSQSDTQELSWPVKTNRYHIWYDNQISKMWFIIYYGSSFLSGKENSKWNVRNGKHKYIPMKKVKITRLFNFVRN